MPAIELSDGALRIRWDHASLSSVRGVCTLEGDLRFHSQSWQPAHGFGPAGGWVEAACGPLRLKLEIAVDGDRVRLLIHARSSTAARVTELGLTAHPILGNEPPTWMIYDGYQSWDPAGYVRINRPGEEGESWWTGGLATSTGGGLGLAALSAHRMATRFSCSTAGLRIFHATPAPKGYVGTLWAPAAGDAWEGEPVLVAPFDDLREGLKSLTGTIVAAPSVPVPRGWLTWYHFGPWITADTVLENSQALLDNGFHQLGETVIQIDDGWQQAYGDWVPNEKFPAELAELVRTLSTRKQTTGIWTAPFLVSAHSKLAETAPDDWFVLDASSGERLIDPYHWVYGPMQILDASRPAVREHLEATFSRLYEAGIRYFKLDFLYAGAYSGVAALRAGLEAIRRVTADSYLLGCGCPLLPVVGIVEGCRIGQDTATPVYDFDTGSHHPTVFANEVNSVCRNLAARHFLAGWFQLDADIALVGGNLDLNRARQLVSAVVLSGGPFFVSDHLPELESDRLALLTNPEILALLGRGTAIPDWEPNEDDLPASVWRGPEGLLGLFNWTDQPRSLAVEVPGHWQVRDLWARADLDEIADRLDLQLDEHGCRLLRLTPA